MLTLYKEQQDVVDKALQGCSIRTTAHAGTGKTTTALALSRAVFEHDGRRTLLLCYNTDLKESTVVEAQKWNLTHCVDIRTIHSAAGFLAGQVAKNDVELERVLNITPWTRPARYDVIVADELQDCNPLLFESICRIIDHCSSPVTEGKPAQIVLLGDPQQCIYGFRGASPKYLMYPEEHFNQRLGQKRKFESCFLSTNNRSSKKICNFVNSIPPSVLADNPYYKLKYAEHKEQVEAAWGNGLVPCPAMERDDDQYEHPVCYKSTVECHENIGDRIQHLKTKYPREDIVILAPNYAEKSPFLKLINTVARSCSTFDVREHKEFSPHTVTLLSHNKVKYNTIFGAKGGGFDHVIMLRPGRYNERQWHRDQERQHPDGIIPMGMYDFYDAFNLRHTGETRAKKTLTVCQLETPLSYLTFDDVPETKPYNSRNLKLKDLWNCGLDLSQICSYRTLQFGEHNTNLFDQDVCLYPGRFLGEVENYKPLFGLQVEMHIAQSLNVLHHGSLCNELNTRYNYSDMECQSGNNIAVPDSSWCSCGSSCGSSSSQPGCPLNKNSFLDMCEARDGLSDMALQQRHEWFLKLAMYHHCRMQKFRVRQFTHLNQVVLHAEPQLEQCRQVGLDMIHWVIQHIHGNSCLITPHGPLHLQHHKKVTWSQQYQGELDFVVGPVVLECKITSAIQQHHMLQALLYSALHNNNLDSPCYVMAPNLGQLVEIQPLPGLTPETLITMCEAAAV